MTYPSPHAPPQPSFPDKPSWFRVVMVLGIAVVGRLMTRHPVHAALTQPLQKLLCHTIPAFARLFAAFLAGRLPGIRRRSTRVSRPRLAPPRKPLFPMRRGWLVHELGYEAAGFASQLDAFLADPQVAAFLAASPQARRLLRPVRHMLGISPPRRQPIARRPRAPRPVPEIPIHRSLDPLTKRTAKRPYWMPSPARLRRERAVERFLAGLPPKPKRTA